MWEILFTSKARKQIRKLPQDMQVVLNLLAKEIQQYGPVRTTWPHYGKLKGRKEVHHCHLNKGRPRYVAVWQVTDTTIKLIEVQYVGTHEKAPY